MTAPNKFVQLGLRKKGKIVKNEQYSIKAFIDKIKNVGYGDEDFFIELQRQIKNLSFWDRINKDKVNRALDEAEKVGFIRGYGAAFKHIETGINKLIDSDTFNKRRRK